RRNSIGGPSLAGRIRIPKLVSKKPRRPNRSFSARMVRWSAWKKSSEGNATGTGRTITQNPRSQKTFRDVGGRARARLRRGGFERQGQAGQLARRRTQETS